MKKKIFKSLMICIIIISIGFNKSYGAEEEGTREKLKIYFAQSFVELGDALNLMINKGQLYIYNLTTNDMAKLVYAPSEITTNSIIDNYVRFHIAPTENKYKVIIENHNEGIDIANAEIPFIPVELYNFAIGNVSDYDINFFEVDKTIHPDGKKTAWNYARSFFTVFSRGVLYLCTAFLIIVLIWHGINVVLITIENPLKLKEHIDGFKKFGTSVLMLVAIFFIMTLSVYGSKYLLKNFVDLPTGDEFPIRVTAEEAGIEFSTNYTGYCRYLAEITNVKMADQKFEKAFKYILATLLNLLCTGIMIVRLFFIGVLSIIAPIMPVLYALDVCDIKTKFVLWTKTYILVAMSNVVFLIISLLFFESLM